MAKATNGTMINQVSESLLVMTFCQNNKLINNSHLFREYEYLVVVGDLPSLKQNQIQ